MKQNICILIIALSIFSSKSGIAQEVIASTGIYIETSSLTMDYTVGEIFVSTFSNSTNKLQQGFHQPSLSLTTSYQNPSFDYMISAYPNPTTDYLTVECSSLNKAYYLLFDIQGKLIEQNNITNHQTKIDVQELISSTYILKILDSKNHIKTFKIVKQ